jgi:hypothetical protein
MSMVHRFLGLPDHRLKRYDDSFQRGNYQRAMPDGLKARLTTYFEPHNRELFRWLGEEFDWN